MKLAKTTLDKIYIPIRHREILGDLEQLGESIEEIGQIQTIAVRELGEGDEEALEHGYYYELLAGGRRLIAMKKKFLVSRDVDVTVFPPNLTTLEKLTIELCENVERKDFDWREEAALKRKLHRLLTEAQNYRREENPSERPWTQEDTADAIGVARTMVTEDIGIAEAVESMPEVFEGVKTRKDAKNLLARMVEKLALDELAKRAKEEQKDGTIEEYRDKFINSYHLGDFFEWAKEQPDNTYDLVEFDPDYGIKIEYAHNPRGTKTVQRALFSDYSFVSREVEQYTEYLEGALKESYRLAKEDAWLILWFAQDPWFEIVFQCMKRSGWNGKRIPGVWFKDREGKAVGNPDKDLGRVYETFFYGYKGDARINKRGRGDVYTYSPVKDRVHPTEKPIHLYRDIFSTFCRPGSKILIPHLGSGSGIFAAASEGMSAEGCDLNNEARNGFIGRVMEMKKPLEGEK